MTVTWSGSARTGSVPGRRALASVDNPRGASGFGQGTAGHRALRRISGDVPSGTEWLLRVPIGDRDLATFLEDGFYAIPFTQMEASLRGTPLEGRLGGIPVSRLALVGGSADTMPEVPATSSPALGELWQIPLTVLDHGGPDGSGDGIWNAGDTLVFFGAGTSLWKRVDLARDSGAQSLPGMEYYFTANPYAFERNLMLGVLPTGQQAKRLETLPAVTGGGDVSQLTRYLRAEKELMLRDTYFGKLSSGWEENSGKEWFWIWANTKQDSLTVPSVELTLPQVQNLPGIVSGQVAKLGVCFYPYRSIFQAAPTPSNPYLEPNQEASILMSQLSTAQRFQGLKFRFEVNGQASPDSMPVRQPGRQFVVSTSALQERSNAYVLTILPNGKQPDRFDGFTVAYPWTPAWRDTAETLLPGALGGTHRFILGNAGAASLRVLKLAGERPVGLLPLQAGAFTDSLDSVADIRYHLFQWGAWKSVKTLAPVLPPPAGVITDVSQLPTDADYVIVSPHELLAQAMRLKNFRSDGSARDRWKTEVVDLLDIALEFGGGIVSPVAVRDFLRHAHANWPSLRYALLVGSGQCDYRRIRPTSPQNLMPPYEREDMGTDDYFSILDSGEALFYWNYDRDLAVGRLPISNATEFEVYLSKLKDYEGLAQLDGGNWRNTLILSADDAMQKAWPDPIHHTKQMEGLAVDVDSLARDSGVAVDQQKIYLMAYPRDVAMLKPDAARDLVTRLNQGALFTFYFGHGSPVDWSDEGLLRPSTLGDVDNRFRYTILGSFACTVGRFDLSGVVSLSELFLNAPQKGAIASIGAMRESFPTPNSNLARRTLENAMVFGSPTLGDAFFSAKGMGLSGYSWERYNSEKYVILGEPVLAMPHPSVRILLDSAPGTVQALQNLRISGKVLDGASAGKLQLQLLEGAQTRILSQDQGGGVMAHDTVQYPGLVVHSEVLGYQDGHFSTRFVTPRKLSLGDTNAQLRLWSWSPGDGRLGRSLLGRISLLGISPYADSIHDKDPPQIHFRPCGLSDSMARSYPPGMKLALEIPACIEVLVTDSTGVYTGEGPDEGITFEVLGVKEPWHPWPFLEQTGQRVLARMQFTTDWKPGHYDLKVRAQDVLGNQGVQALSVDLIGEIPQALSGVFNAPNPVGKDGTTFYFRDLAENHRSLVTIEIFGVDGRLVRVLRDVRSGVTRFDGRDHLGRLLANGLYHYVVTCTVFPSEGKPRHFEARQKLVISR